MRRYPIDHNGHDFQFTRGWFMSRNYATFVNHVLPEWAGKPVVYLEIGVFEGMSLCWMLQHVLAHPEARAVGVDPWLMTTKLSESDMEAVRQRAQYNVQPWQCVVVPKVQLIRGSSVEVLRRMLGRGGYAGITKNSVDLCMVDGDHNRLGAYDDMVNSLRLLKPGGWLLFDDVENDKKKNDHVKDAVKMFLDDHGGSVNFLWKDRYMECYRKKQEN